MKQDTWLIGQETEQLLTGWICSEAKDKKNETACRQYMTNEDRFTEKNILYNSLCLTF